MNSISATLLFIGIATNFFLKDTFKQFQLISVIKSLQNKELEIRKNEKDFLAYEISNENFHRNGKSQYLDNIQILLQKIKIELKELNESRTIKQLNLTEEINQTNAFFILYEEQLNKMVGIIMQKGFKDFGWEGEMREKIHDVESALSQIQNPDYMISMLLLRRHEKDYLLRKDLKYRDSFNSVYMKFVNEIERRNRENERNLIPLLTQYHDIFYKVIESDVLLGIDNENGLRYQINNTVAEIEERLLTISSGIDKTSNKKINRIVLNLFLFIGLSSLLIVYILVRTSQHIVRSLSNLRHYITRLGKGELPDEIPIYNNDEIAHMKSSINELTKNLKNTKEFAEAVGNGNFEMEVNVFGNQGDLGSALVEMRQKLLQVSDEREKQKKEADERLWANEGFNQFHTLLTSNYSQNNDYYYGIISKLVNYLRANQGTFFITESKDDETVLMHKATFAYDRRRLNDKYLKIGEGLIGAVAYEKQSQYFTQLPPNYITLTSGLGEATPGYLIIVPCLSDNELMGIIEIASFNPIKPYEILFIERVAYDLASTIRKIRIEETTNELLRKTQIQAQELSEKEEEMRQNLEELKATQEVLEVRENELLREIDFLKNEKQSSLQN